MDNFNKTMTSKSDLELVEIVEFLMDDYQVEAVQAAKEELTRRQLNEKQYFDLKQQIIGKQKVQASKKRNIDDELKEIIDLFKPGKTKSPVAKIRLIGILLAVYYLLFYSRFLPNVIKGMFHPESSWLLTIDYTISYLVFPIAIITLYEQKRWSWLFIMGLLTNFCLESFAHQIFVLRYFSNIEGEFSLLPLFDNLVYNYWDWIALILPFFAVITLINSQLRKSLGITSNQTMIAFGSGVIYYSLLYIGIKQFIV